MQAPAVYDGAALEGDDFWKYCEVHQDRIKHFYCVGCREMGCRACTETYHLKSTCGIVELYDVEDVNGFLLEMERAAKLEQMEKSITEKQKQRKNIDLRICFA